MNKTDQLKQIRTVMGEALVMKDREYGHEEADEQLMLTIRTLSRGTKSDQVCREIIELYKRMEKWYA